ncbi:MAG: twin-arginine translocation signal domain-containing protein, partial [Caldilineaceae bacterium]|nr:twin-arginine translocation signal domain-containing protein [Caldilineaceae bacterium]
MGKVQLQISRRTFLKSALAGSAGLAVAGGHAIPAVAAPE